MKLLVVGVNNTQEGSEAAQFMKGVFGLWKKAADKVKEKDTTLTFRLPKGGVSDLQCWFHTYIHHLNDAETFHSIVQAEKDSFDAVMINCFLDPMLREIRQAVDIPVVSIGEASMRFAATIGKKFGVGMISEKSRYDYEEVIEKYGLKEQAILRPFGETPEEQALMATDAHHGIEAFEKMGREMIAEGAESLIAGCGLHAPGLRLAPGAEKEYPNGLTDVDGVPVIDVVGVTVKLAETLVRLKQAGSTWISRAGYFAQAPPEVVELGHGVLEYRGPGFWDIEL